MRFALILALSLTLSLPGLAQQLRRVTDSRPGAIESTVIDQDGDTVVAAWRGDPLGANPDHDWTLYRWNPPATTPVALLTIPYSLFELPPRPSLTDDGATIAIVLDSDPLGTNADGSGGCVD